LIGFIPREISKKAFGKEKAFIRETILWAEDCVKGFHFYWRKYI